MFKYILVYRRKELFILRKLFKKRPFKRPIKRRGRSPVKQEPKTISKRFISQAYVSMLFILMALVMSFFNNPGINSVSDRIDAALAKNSYSQISATVKKVGKNSIAVIKDKAYGLTNSILGNTKDDTDKKPENGEKSEDSKKEDTYVPESSLPEG